MKSRKASEQVSKLQNCLSALIDLSLQTKQAHWNCVGPHFKPVHLQLDDVVDATRDLLDEIAERMAFLGAAPEGGLSATAKRSPVEPLPDGSLEALVAAREIAERLRTVTDVLRDAIAALDSVDPISQDLLVAGTRRLEAQLWMLEALQKK